MNVQVPVQCSDTQVTFKDGTEAIQSSEVRSVAIPQAIAINKPNYSRKQSGKDPVFTSQNPLIICIYLG